ncbi:MAG: flippase [Deltaproteobacteria bacterium]|nr:flippase [Deltaproteobacteria bacterium]
MWISLKGIDNVKILKTIPIPLAWHNADTHMKEVIQGASVAFSLKLIGAGLNFAFNLLLARMLGAEGAGIYFLALTIATFAAIFGRIGLDNALLRFTAANASNRNWAAVKGIYQKGIFLVLTASIISSIVMYTISPWLAEYLFFKPELTKHFRLMALAVTPMALFILHAEMLKGLKLIFCSQMIEGVTVPFISLIGLYFLGNMFGVRGGIWAYIIATVFTTLLGYMLWKVATPKTKGLEGKFLIKDLLHSSMPLFVVSVMNLLMMWTGSIMLGIWGTKADVGVFNIASRTAALLSFILIAVNSISAPKFAAMYRQGDIQSLGTLTRCSSKIMAILASPILLIFVLVPEQVMGLFGPQFLEGALVLSILAIGQFINVATGSVGYLLLMSGNEHLMRNTITVSALLNVFLNLIMIKSGGVIGVAVATAISLAGMNLVLAYLVWSRLKIWTLPIIWGNHK